MVQGQRVVMGIFLILHVLINAPIAYASQREFQVTAFVPVSNLWSRKIAESARVEIESSGKIRKPIKIRIINNMSDHPIIKQNHYRIVILLNNKKIQTYDLLSQNHDESIGFAFVPEQFGAYTFICSNMSYEKPIDIDKPKEIIIQPDLIDQLTSLLTYSRY